MNVFISHSTSDEAIAGNLFDLLQVGVGLPFVDVFLSSSKGKIPNGKFFVEEILKRLDESNLIIALISKSYFKSQFCLQALTKPPPTFANRLFCGTLRREQGVLSGLVTRAWISPDKKCD